MPPATSGHAVLQSALVRQRAGRFKDEDLISYLNRTGTSRAPNDHAYEQCCNYRLLNQRHYALNGKRVDLSADVPYLQHGRLLLSLPSRSWLPPCRRGSELYLGGTGIGETGIEPGVDKRFQKGLCTIHGRVSLFLVHF
jgi:hypothetical protein